MDGEVKSMHSAQWEREEAKGQRRFYVKTFLVLL